MQKSNEIPFKPLNKTDLETEIKELKNEVSELKSELNKLKSFLGSLGYNLDEAQEQSNIISISDKKKSNLEPIYEYFKKNKQVGFSITGNQNNNDFEITKYLLTCSYDSGAGKIHKITAGIYKGFLDLVKKEKLQKALVEMLKREVPLIRKSGKGDTIAGADNCKRLDRELKG